MASLHTSILPFLCFTAMIVNGTKFLYFADRASRYNFR